MSHIDIKITADPIDPNDLIDFCSRDGSGAINLFIGSVRDESNGRKVIGLEFEAYEKMAIAEMKKIAVFVIDQWNAKAVAIYHRSGKLIVGELPVVIGVSTPHRKESFEACQYAIDTLKQTVPIWKKEIFEDGEVWVSAHP